jgi:hypothetical protein
MKSTIQSKIPRCENTAKCRFKKLKDRFETTGSVTYKKKETISRENRRKYRTGNLLMLEEKETDISRSSIN